MRSKLLYLIRQKKEFLVLLFSIILCLIAMNNPVIEIKRTISSYMLLVDVSQSMNAKDTTYNDKNISRIDYTKLLIKKIIDSSKCGSYFSVNIFAADNVAAIIGPVEKCKNYDELIDTIEKLEWRMAWKGNSRITFGVKSAAKMQDSLNFPSKILFFTDGDEAPKVNAINRVNLDSGKDEPDPSVASAEYDRYLSKLYSSYLLEISNQINALYITGNYSNDFISSVLKNKPKKKIKSELFLERPSVFIILLLIFLLYTEKYITFFFNKLILKYRQ